MFIVDLSRTYYSSKYTRALCFSFMLMISLLVALGATQSAFADRDGLTGILVSSELAGSVKYLKYMEWYGVLTNAAISVVCLICLGQCVLTFLCTIGYYTAPNYWDMVDAIKQNGGSGGGGGGMMGGQGGMNGGGMSAGISSGFDSIVDAVNSMNINLKRYSDCSAQYQANINIDEYSTGWEYLVAKGPIMICMILFLNMGWKGTLQHMIAATVDAMTVYAESMPYHKMVEWAEWKAAQETGYEFVLGLSGTEEGKIKERLARQMFSKVMSIGRFKSPEDIQALGTAIEASIANIEEKFVLPEHLRNYESVAGGRGEALASMIWPQLSFSIGLSTSTEASGVNQGVYFKVSDFKGKIDSSVNDYEKYYVIVALRYTEHTNQGVFTEKNLSSSTINDRVVEAKVNTEFRN